MARCEANHSILAVRGPLSLFTFRGVIPDHDRSEGLEVKLSGLGRGCLGYRWRKNGLLLTVATVTDRCGHGDGGAGMPRTKWLEFPLQIRVVAGICHEAGEFLTKCACSHPVRGILARSSHKALDKVLNNRHARRDSTHLADDLNFADHRRPGILPFAHGLR